MTITLDNSRSTDLATFTVVHSTRTDDAPGRSTETEVEVEAGQSTTQDLSLADRVENDYRIEDAATHTVLADSGYRLCDVRPRITISGLSCQALSVTATLDNSRSATATTFRVAGGSAPRTEVVGAGRTLVRTYPLRRDSLNQYAVSVGDLAIYVTSAAVFCGSRPKVTLGAFDCTRLVAPVTIDNSGTKGQFSFLVRYSFSYADFSTDLTPVVEPGQVVVLKVPLGANAYTTVSVSEEFPGGRGSVDTQHRGLCGLAPGLGRVTVGDVSCATGAFDVAVDNRQTPPRRAQHSVFLVASSRWGRQDRSPFHRFLELGSDARATVKVNVRALHGGRLRVIGYPGWWAGNTPDAVLFIGTVRSNCQAQGPVPHEHPAPDAAAALPTTGELARTGGPDLGLVPLGLLMTVSGAGAIWLSRRFAG